VCEPFPGYLELGILLRERWVALLGDPQHVERFSEATIAHEVESTLASGVVIVEAVQLLDFWSPTCGPCKRLEPALDSFEQANLDVIEVVNIDTTAPRNRAMVRRHRVNAVPTLVILKDGYEVSRARGITPTHAAITNWVSKFVPGVK